MRCGRRRPRNSRGLQILGIVVKFNMMCKSVIIGEKSFAAITAVEGLSVSQSDSRRMAQLRRQGLSNNDIRAAIIADIRLRAPA